MTNLTKAENWLFKHISSHLVSWQWCKDELNGHSMTEDEIEEEIERMKAEYVDKFGSTDHTPPDNSRDVGKDFSVRYGCGCEVKRLFDSINGKRKNIHWRVTNFCVSHDPDTPESNSSAKELSEPGYNPTENMDSEEPESGQEGEE